MDLASIAGTITDTQHGTKTGIPDSHHREYGWIDEQGWVKKFLLPFVPSKSVGWAKQGIVIDLGATGDPDETGAAQLSLGYRNGKLYMPYVGFNPVREKLCGAESIDFINFTKVGEILDPDALRAGATHIRTPSLIYDIEMAKWMLWVVVGDAGFTNRQIVYQETTVTPPWTGWTNTTLLTMPATWNATCSVIKFGALYYMGAEDVDGNLRCYTSSDGINWVDRGVILSLGAAGTWDAFAIRHPSLWWNMGIFYLLYTGLSQAGVPYNRCGMAYTTSDDPLNYSRYFIDNGQILEVGAAGEWDDVAVAMPGLIMYGRKFYLYYSGYDGSNWRIGLATIP